MASIIIDENGNELISELDFVVSEMHNISASVTNKPVENQKFITDNVYIEPKTLSLTAFVSGDPDEDYSYGERTMDIWQKLDDLVKSKKTVDVYTNLLYYEDMILVNVRTSLTSFGLMSGEFFLDFMEVKSPKINIIKKIPNLNIASQSAKLEKKNLGVKSTTDLSKPKTPTEEKRSSVLFNVVGGIFS